MAAADWRDDLLGRVTWADRAAGGPVAVRYGTGRIGGTDAVVCAWDFSVHGGSFGTAEADVFVAACGQAAATRRPLVTLLRTGGVRLQQGMAALVGIPRAALALADLATARVAHIAVIDHPTTGGVWVGVGALADLRLAVTGATVGFSGPRVVTAMTGEPAAAGSNTAASALAAGLVDAVVEPAAVAGWLAAAVVSTTGDAPPQEPPPPPPPPAAPAGDGWEQVRRARSAGRPDGAALLDAVLDGAVELRPGLDGTGLPAAVRAAVGRSALGRPTVGVALADTRDGRPTPAGFRLLARAAGLAGRIGADLLTLVDTPGADPGPASEDAGLAAAIAAATAAVLDCPAPTLAVVHGEGGSGGALAAAVADRVLVTPNGYFAALGPEGAAAALRTDVADAARLLRLRPADLLADGFADGLADPAPDALRVTVAAGLARLAAEPEPDRLARRRNRWSGPLPCAAGTTR